MKVTILGTANAWGVNEIAGTAWPLEGVLSDGTRVPFRKYRTSLLVETYDDKKILVDCGPDFAHQRREFRVGVVDAIVLTHPHLDHIGGLNDCNVYRAIGRTPTPAYAHPACWRSIKIEKGFGHLVDDVGVLAQHDLELPLRPFRPFSGGSVSITPFGVEHSVRAPGSVGFVFAEEKDGVTKRVAYTGDLYAVSDPTLPVFSDPLDALIIECDRAEGPVGPAESSGHMSFTEIIGLLSTGVFSRCRPKQLVLVHFGDNGPRGITSTYQDWRETVCRGLFASGLEAVMPNPDMVIAYDGMSFVVL